MTASPPHAANDPFVVFRSVNRDGETYALDPRSLARLRQVLPTEAHPRARVFITHETVADYEHVHASVVDPIIQLLTGIAESRLRPFGEVIFLDPVTERQLPVTEQDPPRSQGGLRA